MAGAALTHHQILGLVEPFTRRGWQVDLAASQRQLRQLAFRPQQHAEVPGQRPALAETLLLDASEPGRHRLTRRLQPGHGPAATLVAEGDDLAALLARLDAVPPQRQWHQGPGWRLAFSHRVAGAASGPADGLQLTAATLQLDAGLSLAWTPPPVHSRLAELVLQPGGDLPPPDLPDDLLAVLGHGWTRLSPQAEGWRAYLRQRGRGLAASVHAEQRLQRTAAHLAATLAEPPSRFHARHRLGRWAFTARRAVPLAVCLGLVAAAAAVPRLGLAQESVMRMLILNAPPLLLIGFFCLREVPRIEIPPWPRPLRASRWRPAGAAPAHEPLRST